MSGTSGVDLISAERRRQMVDLDYTEDHDSQHTDAEWVWLIQLRTTDLLDLITRIDSPHRDKLFAQIGALAAAAIDAGST